MKLFFTLFHYGLLAILLAIGRVEEKPDAHLSWFWYSLHMNDHYSDTRRLADAITALAATMTEIMTGKLRAIADGTLRGIGNEIALKTIQPLMTAKHLAKHLGVTTRTLENWMKRGYVPYLKLGRNVRFNLADVEEHLRRCHRVCRMRV